MADIDAEYRHKFVAALKEAGCIRSVPVENAFADVPRHIFIPGVPLAQAYMDRSHPMKMQGEVMISSSSQPAIMAVMLEQLKPCHGERILEIGAGSGYNAALLAYLVSSDGFVSTVDLDADIVEAARQHLQNAGYASVMTRCGDGADGDIDYSPFDAIVATVGVGDIPEAWFKQLRIGGRLIVPLALGLTQRVVTFERTTEGLKSRSVVSGEFMPFRGSSSAAFIGNLSPLGDPAIRLRTSRDQTVDIAALVKSLNGRHRDTALSQYLSVNDLWQSLDLWLSIRESGFCRLVAHGVAAERGVVPDSMQSAGASARPIAATMGLCDGEHLALFALGADGVFIRSFGNGASLVDRLLRNIESWHESGRPRNSNLSIRAYPAMSKNKPRLSASFEQDIYTTSLPSSTLVLKWN